jgi:hypothetical protein
LQVKAEETQDYFKQAPNKIQQATIEATEKTK